MFTDLDQAREAIKNPGPRMTTKEVIQHAKDCGLLLVNIEEELPQVALDNI